MKLTILLIFSMFASLSFARDDDGGWTSAGGGEFIVDRHNPWFLGDGPVSWCISHGGKDNFSLSKEDSKIEIERGIESLLSQLKPIYKSILGVVYNQYNNGTFEASYAQDANRYSLNYVYKENCSDDVDLVYILGDINHKYAKSLLKKHGEEKFRRMAGIAIRTSYDPTQFRAKGFIYIAADKGPLSYSETRNVYINSSTIWDNIKKVDPNLRADRFLHPNIKLKKSAYGPLVAVAAHEFGHTLGYQHSRDWFFSGQDSWASEMNSTYQIPFYVWEKPIQIMDQDLPSVVIGNGFIPKTAFFESVGVIRDSLEVIKDKDTRIMWTLKSVDKERLKHAPFINKFYNEYLMKLHASLSEPKASDFLYFSMLFRGMNSNKPSGFGVLVGNYELHRCPWARYSRDEPSTEPLRRQQECMDNIASIEKDPFIFKSVYETKLDWYGIKRTPKSYLTFRFKGTHLEGGIVGYPGTNTRGYEYIKPKKIETNMQIPMIAQADSEIRGEMLLDNGEEKKKVAFTMVLTKSFTHESFLVMQDPVTTMFVKFTLGNKIEQTHDLSFPKHPFAD